VRVVENPLTARKMLAASPRNRGEVKNDNRCLKTGTRVGHLAATLVNPPYRSLFNASSTKAPVYLSACFERWRINVRFRDSRIRCFP